MLDKEAKLFYFEPYYAKEKEYITFAQVTACVGPGWSPLLEELCEKLFFLGWDGGLSQVKEKFGTLRFYFRASTGLAGEIQEDVVERAEDLSGQVCEECGAYGSLHSDGWMKTSCEPCWEKRLKEKK